MKKLLQRGGLLAINHSGGNDSQAMTIALLSTEIPLDQIVIVHADLGVVEWPGVLDHIRNTTHGLPLLVARANKTFFEMVRRRKMFPSPQHRQCTSDLKRGPIERELRHFLKENLRFGGQVVSAMGLRADESSSRANRKPLVYSKRNSVAGRTWFIWLPIHAFSSKDVFATIDQAGEAPHWAYSEGMSRLSCSFCIMSSKADLRTAARLRPGLYRHYRDLEIEVGHTLSPSGKNLRSMISGD